MRHELTDQPRKGLGIPSAVPPQAFLDGLLFKVFEHTGASFGEDVEMGVMK